MSTDLHATVAGAVAGHRLLDHPFYRRWEEGRLGADELAAYAEQYRHVEGCLPGVLQAAADAIDTEAARLLVEQNLADERGGPVSHLQLFESFALGVGARPHAAADDATRALVEVYEEAARRGPSALLAVVGAYEVQAAEVARTKAESLRAHYGLGADETVFWDVHGELEEDHARWTIEALEALGASPSEVAEFAGRSAGAWWRFLDERDAAAC